MKRFFFLGDSERYYRDKMDKPGHISLVTGYSLKGFLDKTSRIKFDLLIIDGSAGTETVRRHLEILERGGDLPPVLLALPPDGSCSPSLSGHYLVKSFYDGPPLLSDLLEFCLSVLRRAGTSAGFEGLSAYCGIVGISPGIKGVWGKIEKYGSHIDYPVLIQGENGTGKELVARALYETGHGAKAPFVPYQASAVEEQLMASDLFGVRKGAFTGSEERKGLLSLAGGGVFFLDEVGLLSQANQRALLRVLEEGRMRPLGSSVEESVDFRLISATNEDIAVAVEEGRFRRDLYHRINLLMIRIPPLRERREDIPLLAESFLENERAEQRFTEGAMGKMLRHTWPGNIRELRNVVFRSLVECGSGRMIESRHVLFD